MGYGHLRAAHALADALGVPARRLDLPPIARPQEVLLWGRLRRFYERLSRVGGLPLLGRPAAALLERLTAIEPLEGGRDLARGTHTTRTLENLVLQGFQRRLVARLRETGEPLVSTFYASAIAADRAGHEPNLCVATDTDLNRVWAPPRAARTRIRYAVPSARTARRLEAYGVPPARLHVTGFPLPPTLVEERAFERNLDARLARLDPTRRGASTPAPLVTFAVGGAGAQASLARRALRALVPEVEAGRLRLALVAGVRREVRDRFRRWVDAAGLGGRGRAAVEILYRPTFEAYYAAFNALLARTDVLWTKPSELVFYAALGLPLVLAPPLGAHERTNRAWVVAAGAARAQEDPRRAGDWLRAWIQDGTLAAAACAGARDLERHGTRHVVALVASA
jgi:UDP-N-acetylglucosamine:LPS N-acetylglucosamine transferase